jgi:DNA-packaging protein gp3
MESSKKTTESSTEFPTINHWMIKSYGIGTSAEDLWKAACQYFMWCEANPITASEVVKQTGAQTTYTKPRAFNLPALCLHLGCAVSYILDNSVRPAAGEYYMVCQRILQVIYAQKYEYSMAGIFPAALVGKELNLGFEDEQVKRPSVINVVVEGNSPPLISNESDVKL